MPSFPRVLLTLEQSLKAANLRHSVIANNIANVNVPDFKPSEVAFEEHLKEALAETQEPAGLQGLTTHERHIPIGTGTKSSAQLPEPLMRQTAGLVMRQDGNNVDPDAEMAKLAANQLWYQALVRSVGDEFARLRTVISEGRR